MTGIDYRESVFRIGLVTDTDVSHGIQIGLLNSANISRYQVGCVNSTGRYRGFQAGLLNFADSEHLIGIPWESKGLQAGIFNDSDEYAGVQVGLANNSENLTGVQAGAICVAREGTYLQIGLITVRRDSPLYARFSPFVGWHRRKRSD